MSRYSIRMLNSEADWERNLSESLKSRDSGVTVEMSNFLVPSSFVALVLPSPISTWNKLSRRALEFPDYNLEPSVLPSMQHALNPTYRVPFTGGKHQKNDQARFWAIARLTMTRNLLRVSLANETDSFWLASISQLAFSAWKPDELNKRPRSPAPNG